MVSIQDSFARRFATGFNLDGKTMPGYSVENEKFILTFSEVFCDGKKNDNSYVLECCYDWSEVMNMILAATENYVSRDDVKKKFKGMLKTWLTSFEGWGLLSSMLPTQKQRYFLENMAKIRDNWNQETGGPYSDQKVFDMVKELHEGSPGKGIRLGAYFEEICKEVADESREREKSFVVFFIADELELDVKFTLEKKKLLTNNLVDIAAEKVAQIVIDTDYIDIESLEIPSILLEKIHEKCRDIEWVYSHWEYESELEANRSEIDVNDLEDLDDIAEPAIENVREGFKK